ncbi:hypothetical protein [Sulfuriferula sp.]|uniref:hypothetical protein n=1 Tax=Sulfuriferula sp. TaxID=2025307 RepID=UPI002731648B|nr:hypothetical protein [Sulfuriferula sp.]MDP2026746.1 hypothetical protein [Sulfuriferula sp.]
MDELIDLVHQAVYEVDELRACIEDEPDEMERYMPFIDQLDRQLRILFDNMTSGRYTCPGEVDLEFMSVVQKWGRDIPFKPLLLAINQAHRKVDPSVKTLMHRD